MCVYTAVSIKHAKISGALIINDLQKMGETMGIQ
jgi:hypothetical protein